MEHPLKPGYYILQHIADEYIKYEYLYVSSFSVYSLNNMRDFVIKVIDSDGQPINNAKLRVKRRKLTFDEDLQAYVLPNVKRFGSQKAC